MSQITVIAVARNEACQVEGWLEQLAWASRIVVVDTGSDDGTPELLAAGGAEVHRRSRDASPLIPAAKNEALGLVDEGWILDLDLDERVPLATRDEILVAVEDDDAPAAYRLPLRHYVFGRWLRHGGWTGLHLRLSRAGALRYPENRAHGAPDVEGRVSDLAEPIIHFAHPTLHDFLVKMNRYTSHDAEFFLAEGRGGLRNRAPLPPRPLRWTRAALSVFWNRYVKAAGFRDGVPGFMAAAMLSGYIFVEQAKVWELQQRGVAASADGDGQR